MRCQSTLRTARAARIAWLLLASQLFGCASLPTPVGPAIVAGTIAGDGLDSAVGEAAPDAPQGPLLLSEARVRVDKQTLHWQLHVANPSSEKLAVTLILRLAGAGGEVLGHDDVTLLIGGGDSSAIRESMPVNAASALVGARWQLESWARRLPPPERRLPRISG